MVGSELDRGINLDDRLTLAEFCALTQDSYGGQVIRLLESRLNATTEKEQ